MTKDYQTLAWVGGNVKASGVIPALQDFAAY